jgi:seryl-tRNA synthetase
MPWPTFKTKDEIPEPFRGEYEERDGAWHPKGAGGDGGSGASKLEETLAKVREERKEAERRAREAEESRAALERQLAAASSGEEKDRVTKALKKFDDDLAAAKAEHKKELDAARAELRTLKLDDKVKAAFLAAGGRPERAEKALRDTKERFDLADDGRIVVKDAKGEVSTATVEDFFGKTYRAEMAEFYTGTKATGGGANGGAGATPARTANAGAWDGDAVLKDPMGALNAANAAEAAS